MVFPTQMLGAAKDSAGIVKQVVDLGSSLINPSKVKGIVGKVARPIRTLPEDVKDPGKTKAENKDKRDPTLFEKIFSRITYLHILGVVGVIGAVLQPIIDKLFGPEDQPSLIRGLFQKISNPVIGIGAVILSEISFANKWHVSERQRLEQLGVLENVTDTAKWRQLEVEKHIEQGTFPPDFQTDDATRLLLEVRCSPKHRRATCYEGPQGNGKTFAAYISSFTRAHKLQKAGKTDVAALQINSKKLMDVARDKIAQTAQMGDMLGGKLREFVSEDPMTYANDEIELELLKGSVIVNDDAEYQLERIDERGFQWLKEITDEYGGGYIITIPKSLREVLYANKNLDKSDVKTLLQRIDSISFPQQSNRCTFDMLDESLKRIVSADLSDIYSKDGISEEFHQCYLREQQVGQWKVHLNRLLFDSGEKFDKTQGIGKVLNDYFTDEKLNKLVSKYPMNPRYIGFTVESLGILLGNRRSKGVTTQELDFMLQTILECDTFKNYIRSIDYRAPNSISGFQAVDTTDRLMGGFVTHFKDNMALGFKGVSGQNFDTAAEILTNVFAKGHIPLQRYAPNKLQIASDCLSKRNQDIKIEDLIMFDVPVTFENPKNPEQTFRVVFAVDKNNPTKLYRGYIQEGVEADILSLKSLCDEGNNMEKVKGWMLNA